MKAGGLEKIMFKCSDLHSAKHQICCALMRLKRDSQRGEACSRILRFSRVLAQLLDAPHTRYRNGTN